MTDMLKEGKNGHLLGPFVPTLVIKLFFAELLDTLTKAPVLAHFDHAKPNGLETDASGFLIASIILQQEDKVRGGIEGAVRSTKGITSASKGNWHPVAFWSQSMSSAELNYAFGDQVMLTIVKSCCHWHYYLKCARHLVEVLTDHHNLRRFMTTNLLTGR
jgi:hypothetical protein